MFSILNRALSWAITSFGNKFCLKKRSTLIKALDNRFYVKFMQLEIGLLFLQSERIQIKLQSEIIQNCNASQDPSEVVKNFRNITLNVSKECLPSNQP